MAKETGRRAKRQGVLVTILETSKGAPPTGSEISTNPDMMLKRMSLEGDDSDLLILESSQYVRGVNGRARATASVESCSAWGLKEDDYFWVDLESHELRDTAEERPEKQFGIIASAANLEIRLATGIPVAYTRFSMTWEVRGFVNVTLDLSPLLRSDGVPWGPREGFATAEDLAAAVIRG